VPTICEAMIERAKHPAFGYFAPRREYYDSIIRWHQQRNGVTGLEKKHIGYQNGVLGGVLSALAVLCSAGDNVLVVGLGAVGLLAMQAYARCGYRVSGMDPDPARADLAARLSGCPAWTALPEEAKEQFGLALECSGTQQGVMTCCDALRMGGELSLVGVPWRPTGDVHSYPLLNRIFYQYLTVYSGWEMNLPARPGRFAPDSQLGNMEQAIEWIHAGDIRVDGMEKICSWKELPRLYEAILNREEKSVSILLDWRDSSAG